MKKNLILIASIFVVLIGTFSLYSCKNKNKKDNAADLAAADIHTSQNSLDWAGVYYGIMPCADCEGIETVFTLKQDGSYTIKRKYLGKENQIFTEDGKFEWTKDGNNITLIPENDSSEGGKRYKVGENILFALNSDGEIITGELAEHYKLKKNNSPLVEMEWILTELKEKQVTTPEGGKEAFIRFDIMGSRYAGNASCNTIFGAYKEEAGGKLTLNNAASTMMACKDMTLERDFVKMLTEVEKYSIQNDILTLLDQNDNKLAQFKKR